TSTPTSFITRSVPGCGWAEPSVGAAGCAGLESRALPVRPPGRKLAMVASARPARHPSRPSHPGPGEGAVPAMIPAGIDLSRRCRDRLLGPLYRPRRAAALPATGEQDLTRFDQLTKN